MVVATAPPRSRSPAPGAAGVVVVPILPVDVDVHIVADVHSIAPDTVVATPALAVSVATSRRQIGGTIQPPILPINIDLVDVDPVTIAVTDIDPIAIASVDDALSSILVFPFSIKSLVRFLVLGITIWKIGTLAVRSLAIGEIGFLVIVSSLGLVRIGHHSGQGILLIAIGAIH